MAHAIRISEFGGTDKLRWEEVIVGEPGPGEVRVKSTAIGLNFIDTYHRTGLYPNQLPLTLGMEGAGIVEKVGPKVKDFKVGDRVAWANPIGAYADVLLRPAARLVKIPAGVDDKIAASIMLKGMTAWYLLKRTFKVKKGDTILVHAAAGGVGQILCQWAKALGATDWQVMTRHVLPNAMVSTLTFMPFILNGSIATLTSLDFLGFGLPALTPSWGELLQQAQSFRWAWWLVLYPAAALFTVMLLAVLVGEGLRDAFDPRPKVRLE